MGRQRSERYSQIAKYQKLAFRGEIWERLEGENREVMAKTQAEQPQAENATELQKILL